MQQSAGVHTRTGRFWAFVDALVVFVITKTRLIGNAPVKHMLQFLITLVVSILGIVPGLMNMYGMNHEADIVSVSAGCVAAALTVIQFFPIDEWIQPSNSMVASPQL